MKNLVEITTPEDIFPQYRDTPIELFLKYHNLNLDIESENYTEAQLLIGMCMDNRKHLHIPENFAYIIRSGGANLRHSEFKVSYAIAVGNIQHIVLISHNNCGMVNLHARKDQFIDGLVNKAGWDRAWAEEHFMHFAPIFEIGNEIDFVISEAQRLRQRYPSVMVAPMFYQVETNRLHLIRENA
ncbi:MAG: carbonic anhydrase [Bacteroidetes bacterium]|nr:carbonic anhydrase [Bacteroidota bacterium]